MREIQAISDAYERAAKHFEAQLYSCQANGDKVSQDRVAHEQNLNELAYFVLAWGQLEAEVGEACRKAIRLGRSNRKWRHRRAWSMFDPENPRLSFRRRLMLVLDPGTFEWKRAVELHELRNQIAHGALRSGSVDVSAAIGEFRQIQSSLSTD